MITIDANEPAKVFIWDTETTNLKADFATVLCFAGKFHGAKNKTPRVWSIDDYDLYEEDRTDDRELVADFLDTYNQADVSVTYFGKGFDLKMLHSKCLQHKLPMPRPIPQVDLFFTVKSSFNTSRKSLDTIARFAGLANQKSPVDGRTWVRAAAGYKDALKYIKDHCIADVLVLEDLYREIRGLVRTHPRVGNPRADCRYCGSSKVILKGRAYSAARGIQVRVKCKDCGGWEHRPARKGESELL